MCSNNHVLVSDNVVHLRTLHKRLGLFSADVDWQWIQYGRRTKM